MKRISDYIKELPVVTTEELMGKEVVYHAIKRVKGKKGLYLRAEASFPDKPDHFTALIGGQVLIESLETIDKLDNFPIQARIEKVDDYYVFR